MSEQIFLRIRNWAKFQHYAKRSPVWIKVYHSLLDDVEFGTLDELTQRHFFFIMLLVARTENRLPVSRESVVNGSCSGRDWLAQHIFARSPIKINDLITTRFLEGYNNESKRLLAELYQNACLETETEKRQRRVEKPPSPLRVGFEAYWKQEPKKVGKKASWAVWQKLKPDDALIQKIVAARLRESQFKEIQYMKDPVRWLRGRHWEDVIVANVVTPDFQATLGKSDGKARELTPEEQQELDRLREKRRSRQEAAEGEA